MRRRTFTALIIGMACLLFVPRFGSAQVVRLQIERAIYGYNGQGNDVTNRVRAQIRNNRVEMQVNNDTMGGDPNKGAKKNLKVVYSYGNQRRTKVVNEKDWLRIP